MTTFEQWNYGDGQRGILRTIKKGIVVYEKPARYSFHYAFSHHKQAKLLFNNLLTKTIDFSMNWPLRWNICIIRFFSIFLAPESPINNQGLHVGIS